MNLIKNFEAVRVHLNKYAKIYYLKNILDKDNFFFYKKIILTNF